MDRVEAERRRLVAALEAAEIREGHRPSRLDGVSLVRTSHAARTGPVLYDPCIVVVAQGIKRFRMLDASVRYDSRNFLVLTVPVPFECETEIFGGESFLAVSVRIDPAIVGELLIAVGKERPHVEPRAYAGNVTAPPIDLGVIRAARRLVECLGDDLDARVLGPQFVREFHYRVLLGEGRGALEHLLPASGPQARIHRILHRMHVDCRETFEVSSLARDLDMSVSAFHAQFKSVTGTSPVRYLKTLRLHKARSLMVQDGVSATRAAERVGYENASQFSREFKREFGAPPAGAVRRLRAEFGFDEAAAAKAS